MNLLRSLLFLGVAGATVIVSAVLILLTFWAPSSVPWAITVGWCRLSVWLGRVILGHDTVVEGLENIPDEPSAPYFRERPGSSSVKRCTYR
jgi:1-acyl-sn-glycerol-3-phosphate acyltransferase